jgi:hypothetical protein
MNSRSTPSGSGVDVFVLVGVRVVHPEHAVLITLGGAGALRHGPHICVSPTRRYGVVGLVAAGGVVLGGRALGILVVEHAVWVHAGREADVVPEDDADRIADFGAEQRSQKPEVFPLGRTRLEGCECAVGVLPVERLLVLRADAVRRRVDPRGSDEWIKLVAGGQVRSGGRVIPHDLVGGDVVGMCGAFRLDGTCGLTTCEDHHRTDGGGTAEPGSHWLTS